MEYQDFINLNGRNFVYFNRQLRLPKGRSCAMTLVWDDDRKYRKVLPDLRPYSDMVGTLANLWFEMDLLRRAADAATRALDSLDLACVVFDSQARVIFANRAARTMVSASVRVDSDGQVNPSPWKQFAEAIGEIARRVGSDGDRGPDIRRFPLPAGDVRPAYLVPLGTPSGLFSGLPAARFAVFIPSHRASATARALEVALGLTRSEAKLAEQIALGRSLQEAAEVLSLSEATIRTYAKRIFSKLGISRQSELAASAARQFVPAALPEDALGAVRPN
jgi:DNA-binding CsgD family transcriptional regulator